MTEREFKLLLVGFVIGGLFVIILLFVIHNLLGGDGSGNQGGKRT